MSKQLQQAAFLEAIRKIMVRYGYQNRNMADDIISATTDLIPEVKAVSNDFNIVAFIRDVVEFDSTEYVNKENIVEVDIDWLREKIINEILSAAPVKPNAPINQSSDEAVARVKRWTNSSIIDSTGLKVRWEDLPDGTELYTRPYKLDKLVNSVISKVIEQCKAATGQHTQINRYVNTNQILHDALCTDLTVNNGN
ncbi:MAG: hypothetical protein ABIU85_04730 [Methylotenera sp.]